MAENGNKTALLTDDALILEIRRRYGIIKDQLIGQSPEDLPRHYRLIGQQEAFKGLIRFIDENFLLF